MDFSAAKLHSAEAKTYSAGVQTHSAGVNGHSASAKTYSAGAQTRSADANGHSASAEIHSAGVQTHSAGAKTYSAVARLWISTANIRSSPHQTDPASHSACVFPVFLEISPIKSGFLFSRPDYSLPRSEPENGFPSPRQKIFNSLSINAFEEAHRP
jgi:hypothetical protein